MPANQMGSAQEICPFYRGRGSTHVCCESLVKGTSARLIFRNRKEMEEFALRFCRTHKWMRCPHAAALDDLYDEHGRRD